MSENNNFDEVLAFLEKRRTSTVEDIFNEYLDNKKEITANAVMVPVRGRPYAVFIKSFEELSNAIPPEYTGRLEAQLELPVCVISSFKKENGSENKFIENFIHLYQCYGSCLVCKWDNDKPSPFTNEEAQFAADVLVYAEILHAREEL